MRPSTLAVLCLLLIACATASNAVMDTLSFRYDRSVFAREGLPRSWWDPAVSWRNKWADGHPRKGEAFLLSSTSLVALTDAWHFFKMLTISCLIVALILPFTKIFPLPTLGWVGVFVGMHLFYGLIFEGLFAWGFLVR